MFQIALLLKQRKGCGSDIEIMVNKRNTLLAGGMLSVKDIWKESALFGNLTEKIGIRSV